MSERNRRPSGETESINDDNHNRDQMESDSSIFNSRTEQLMLEDEEMPTYVSISSSSKHDNSSLSDNIKEQDSLLSVDERIRSFCPNKEQGERDRAVSSEEESTHLNNVDNENEHRNSTEMNEMDLENDDKYDHSEGINTKYQQDYSHRTSDDCILNNRLTQRNKESSLSLHDLNNCNYNAHAPYSIGKQSLNIFNHKYLDLQPNQTASAALYKTRIIPRKYQHVQSKVKQYIRNIKEQNRRSKEKHTKEQEFIINKDHKKNEDNIDEVEIPSKTIKDYAKKVIKDLQREEVENFNVIYDTTQIINNDKTSDGIIKNGYCNTEDVEYSHVQSEKLENESTNVNMHIENNDAEMVEAKEIDNNNIDCPLKVQKSFKNVKSIRLDLDELQNFYFANNNTDDRVKTEITELEAQFKQFHQKAVAEIMKLKQELDAVKKSLARYENESRTSETSTVSTKNENTVDSKEINNKASASSIESVMSSIDHWAESAASPEISIKSPNLNSILNSDDSIVLTNYMTPKKVINHLSRTFVTSSRILQTLSNIAQGKVRVESPLARSTKIQLNENSIQRQSQNQLFCDSPSSLKPFVYKDNSNIRNGSFLIQAVEPIKDLENKQNCIHECGPYLLGNLEVRMSEVNGTINLWGEEMNCESENDNEDNIKISEKSSEKKACHWQDTTQIEFNSPLMYSTNKKKRIPSQYNRPNSSGHRNLPRNLVKAMSLENIISKKHEDPGKQMSLSENYRSSQCQERVHLCYTHDIETKDKKRRDSAGTQENVYNTHTPNSKSFSDCTNNHAISNACTQNLSSYNEKVPLIPCKRFNETTKMKQRRLSGKRVRGILADLFKGCGGRSENNATNLNSRSMYYQKGSPHTVNDIPKIKISSPSKLVCDSCTQGNNRCYTHVRGLETQLEKIRVEMERMQSRLIVIVDMLHKLNAIDN